MNKNSWGKQNRVHDIHWVKRFSKGNYVTKIMCKRSWKLKSKSSTVANSGISSWNPCMQPINAIFIVKNKSGCATGTPPHDSLLKQIMPSFHFKDIFYISTKQ